MLKKLLLIILFLSNLSFSQTDKDNYEIYSKVISEQLKFGIDNKTDSIILIEQYVPKFPPEFDIVADFTADSIPDWAYNFLYTQTYRNEEFVNRIKNDKELKNAIKEFTTDFINHPKLNAELLKTDRLNIQIITSEKYYSYFGKKFKRIDKAWKRIKKKYGTRSVIEFSKVKYYKNFATVFYEHHCGGLCGSGNMVVFEKKNGKWVILSEINFRMS
ncbi:hypothetical protein [Bizionia sp. M204]|uniref:hypothetical protein n=1 Tax=Bizionia sp. M204 TaxID=2675331 RepID=UPI0020648395|nr:hypothetical protein [Bizionia sp. M204]UPS90879.1 hypothetical protein GMA17_03730 [Bizionia sp. M204]